MVGCAFAHEIWSRIHTYFALQTKAKIKQLKNQLKSIKKQRFSTSEYHLTIKRLVYSLAIVGSPLLVDEHIEVILDELSEDYATFIIVVLSRVTPFFINEIEALLMAQEDMLKMFRKFEVGLIQANISQASFQDSRFGGEQLMVIEAEEEEVLEVEDHFEVTQIGLNVNFVTCLAI